MGHRAIAFLRIQRPRGSERPGWGLASGRSQRPWAPVEDCAQASHSGVMATGANARPALLALVVRATVSERLGWPQESARGPRGRGGHDASSAGCGHLENPSLTQTSAMRMEPKALLRDLRRQPSHPCIAATTSAQRGRLARVPSSRRACERWLPPTSAARAARRRRRATVCGVLSVNVAIVTSESPDCNANAAAACSG